MSIQPPWYERPFQVFSYTKDTYPFPSFSLWENIGRWTTPSDIHALPEGWAHPTPYPQHIGGELIENGWEIGDNDIMYVQVKFIKCLPNV